MQIIRNIYNKVKRIVILTILWFTKILFAPRHFKVNIFKSVYYAIFGGFMPDQVALYNLNKNNRKEYLSEFDWYKSRYINEPYNFVLNNKIVCCDILKQYINIPEVIVLKQKKRITSTDNKISNYDEIIKEIKKGDFFFKKPNNCGKGKGVDKIEYNKDFFINNEKITEEELINFLKKDDDYHICRGIKQAKYLDDIYDKTSNTIRIITFRNPKTNKFEIYKAVQRIGVASSIPVDNGSRGGLTSDIDIKTGCLTAARCIQRFGEFSIHPDSGNKIEGVIVPNWKEIKKQIVELSNKFSYLYFVAWDVLPTDKGIYIIEANTSSGVNILQLWGGQRNKGLGDFYRDHGIIK